MRRRETGFSGLPQIWQFFPRKVVNAPGQGCRPRIRLYILNALSHQSIRPSSFLDRRKRCLRIVLRRRRDLAAIEFSQRLHD